MTAVEDEIAVIEGLVSRPGAGSRYLSGIATSSRKWLGAADLPLRFVSERGHNHFARCFDFTRIFMELRFIGTHDHLPIANKLASLADR